MFRLLLLLSFVSVNVFAFPVESRFDQVSQEIEDDWSGRFADSRVIKNMPRYTEAAQKQNKKYFKYYLTELRKGMRKKKRSFSPRGPRYKTISKSERKQKTLAAMSKLVTGLTPIAETDLSQILNSGLLTEITRFDNSASSYDSNISDDDIFQAARNVWTALGIQIQMGLPVKLSKSIFGYSMLYPYTDNLLDDPRLSGREKMNFVKRFGQRLQGEHVVSRNTYEQKVWDMIKMMEADYPRSKFPDVWGAIMLIHQGQVDSVRQQDPSISYEEILEISIRKGASSVLADAYLVAGELNDSQFQWQMEYGFLLQIVDDFQDCEEDFKNGHWTLCSFELREKRNITNFALKSSVATALIFQDMQKASMVKINPQAFATGIQFLNVQSALAQESYLSPRFIEQIEASSPIGLLGLKKFLSQMNGNVDAKGFFDFVDLIH